MTTDDQAELVDGHRGNRRALPAAYITGKARAPMAVEIGFLAQREMSDPEIGRKLGITAVQVRSLRTEFNIPPGQPVSPGRRPGVVAKRGDCPVCGRDCALDRFGAVGAHRQELVGAFGQRKYGDWCDGRGQQAETTEGAST